MQKENELYRMVMENINEGIVIIDKDAQISFVNSHMAAMLGYTPEEMAGKSIVSFMEKEETRNAAEYISRCVQGMKAQHDIVFLKKNGARIHTSLATAPLVDSDGKYTGTLAAVRDDTERKRNVETLREKEERFSSMYYNATVGIYRTTPEGKIEMANPALVRMLGFESFEDLAKRDLSHEGFEPQYPRTEFMKRIEQDGEVRGLEAAWKRKDGITLFIRENARLVRDTKNNRIYYEGTVEDITARRLAVEALEKSELRFKRLIENAFEGITIIDINGSVLYESPGINRILGYSTEERQGVGVFDTVHPDDISRVREALGHCIRFPDETVQMVLRIKHKNGTWRWMECVGRNLLHDASINGIVVNYRDVTERRKADEERQKLEQHIQQTQKLESLGVLAGGIAHDFNNLLGGIFGFINLAQLASRDSTVSDYLATAMGTIDRARSLTQQLLTFAKGGTPVRKIGSLAGLIRETAQFALSGSNVYCMFDIPENLHLCDFDKNQIAQVIDNIVINAQQAMPKGGAIEISATNCALRENEHVALRPGDYVKISIKDSGIGIPKEILPCVFDPFFSTKQKGSGLGLTICYSIVKKHDGCIEVESEPGRGTTFHMYLPASADGAVITPKGPVAVHKASGRILIVDDDEIVREAFRKMLETMGYSTVGKKDGKEAMSFFIEETQAGRLFAAVFLDLTIPGGMGGRETVVEIRKVNSAIPVFVSSGYADDPVMANPDSFGFTDSICKPFKIDELILLLNRNLGEKR